MKLNTDNSGYYKTTVWITGNRKFSYFFTSRVFLFGSDGKFYIKESTEYPFHLKIYFCSKEEGRFLRKYLELFRFLVEYVETDSLLGPQKERVWKTSDDVFDKRSLHSYLNIVIESKKKHKKLLEVFKGLRKYGYKTIYTKDNNVGLGNSTSIII